MRSCCRRHDPSRIQWSGMRQLRDGPCTSVSRSSSDRRLCPRHRHHHRRHNVPPDHFSRQSSAMPDAEQYTLSTVAHVKLLMHALKYHYACVNGFLLVEDVRNKTKGKEESNRIQFVDAIPLFHLGHGLTPMIEVALLQVSSYCRERNLLIGGLYFANKYFNDSSPDVFSQKIAEKIMEQNSSAVLLVLDNMGLASGVQEQADAESLLSLHIPTDGKWKQKSGMLKLENPSTAFECVNELILSQGLQSHLKDFDNHLDDICNDWTNKLLNQKIQSFITSPSSSSS